MVPPADLVEHRVDLDRVDVPGAVLQGRADVVARPGADDQDVLAGRAAGVAVQQVGEFVAPRPVAPTGTICWWPMLFVKIVFEPGRKRTL